MFRALFISILSLSISFLAMAKDKPILTIYSYNSFTSEWGPGPKVKQLFEAECNCELKVTSIGDGVMILNRLRLEGNRSKADVIIGLDNNLMAAAKLANLVVPHHIEPFEQRNIDWWDDYFVPYDYGYFAFIYNKELIMDPPTSLASLIEDPRYQHIVYQDPRTSAPGLGLLLWVQYVYGDEASQAWQLLAKKTLTVTKGWSESYGLFLNGEADFVLSYNTSPAVHMMNDKDDRYVAAIFSEGHYLQVETAAITSTSKQPELAQQFLRFLATPEVQSVMATKNIMSPIINIPLPEAFERLSPVEKILEFPADQIEQHRNEWTKIWQNAVSQ